MKNIFPISLILLLVFSCASSQNKEVVFHPIVSKAKNISLYTDQINWEEINKNFIKLTKDKLSIEDQKEGLQYLINSLGDKHASIRSSKDYSYIVNYSGEVKESEGAERDPNFVNNVINDISSKFSYAFLEDGIGYLKVVGIGPGDVKEQSDFIRKGLIDLKAQGVEKWILDLRYNGGGNMEPMISGLAPLLGEGPFGGAVNNRNEVTRTYKIENGQFNNNGRIAAEMSNLPTFGSTDKVAVLLSRYTISSGELVAVAFKGKENTKFIGEATAGYTTGNSTEPIGDEMFLVISEDVYMDRNKVRYDKNVGVDEYVEFQHSTSLENDLQVSKAIEWLNQE